MAPSMLDSSLTLRPDSVGGFSCRLGNFNAPLVVSNCRAALRMRRLATHCAFAWNLGGKAD